MTNERSRDGEAIAPEASDTPSKGPEGGWKLTANVELELERTKLVGLLAAELNAGVDPLTGRKVDAFTKQVWIGLFANAGIDAPLRHADSGDPQAGAAETDGPALRQPGDS